MSNSDKRGEMMRKTYTKKDIITFLQAYYAKNGELLSLKLYRQKQYKPSETTIRKKFGSWNNALEEAGIPINRKVKSWYTKEDIIKHLQSISKNDAITIAREYQKKYTSPSIETVISLFGSWNNALKAAGLKENRVLMDKEDIIKSIQKFAQTFPLDVSVERYRKEEWQPSIDTIYRKFGSWIQALKVARISSKYRTYDEEEIMEKLCQYAEKIAPSPLTVTRYKSSPNLPHTKTIIRQFGSWEKALEKARVSST